jgi:hypothetical protein
LEVNPKVFALWIFLGPDEPTMNLGVAGFVRLEHALMKLWICSTQFDYSRVQ